MTATTSTSRPAPPPLPCSPVIPSPPPLLPPSHGGGGQGPTHHGRRLRACVEGCGVALRFRSRTSRQCEAVSAGTCGRGVRLTVTGKVWAKVRPFTIVLTSPRWPSPFFLQPLRPANSRYAVVSLPPTSKPELRPKKSMRVVINSRGSWSSCPTLLYGELLLLTKSFEG